MLHDLIYDVGMHNGDDTAYYLHRGFRVVAIDANPEACERASERFRAEIDSGRLTILNVGIAPKPESHVFWVCEEHPEWSSFNQHIAARDGAAHHAIHVNCRPLDEILKQYGVPFYLKVDIEGRDLLCIDALRTERDRPKYVSIELGQIDDPLRKLVQLGYTGYKCISQATFLPLEHPPIDQQRYSESWHRLLTQRSLHLRLFRRMIGRMGRQWMAHKYRHTRRQEGWAFPPGSSGPFGEDTLGTWLTADGIREAYNHYRRLFDQGTPSVLWGNTAYSFWIDLHARRDD